LALTQRKPLKPTSPPPPVGSGGEVFSSYLAGSDIKNIGEYFKIFFVTEFENIGEYFKIFLNRACEVRGYRRIFSNILYIRAGEVGGQNYGGYTRMTTAVSHVFKVFLAVMQA
jgi:hypothetical protein